MITQEKLQDISIDKLVEIGKMIKDWRLNGQGSYQGIFGVSNNLVFGIMDWDKDKKVVYCYPIDASFKDSYKMDHCGGYVTGDKRVVNLYAQALQNAKSNQERSAATR